MVAAIGAPVRAVEVSAREMPAEHAQGATVAGVVINGGFAG